MKLAFSIWHLGYMNKILSFTDLAAWQYGHKLKLEIYRFTKSYPKEERYGQTQQIHDAANSITNNLAEGFGRRSENEKIQFYSYALGSLREVQNQLITGEGVGYIGKEQFEEAFALSHLVAKTTAALIASIQRRKTPNANC